MTRRLRPLTTLAVALGATALTLTSPATSAGAAVPTTEIKPGALDRGPAGKVPHVQGSSLVVGTHVYPFGKREVRYLGMAGEDYVVGTWVSGKPASQRAVRVAPDGSRTRIVEGPEPSEMVLSSDGKQLFHPTYNFKKKQTTLRAWSTDTGDRIARHTFRQYVDVLDAQGKRVLLSSYGQHRTFWWKRGTDRTTTITKRIGYRADLSTDRLATMTDDPYQGGCSVVSSISHPGQTLWRSCGQAVQHFSPGGNRMTTTYLLSDGLGPGEVQLRGIHGRLIAKWTTYFFGGVAFEGKDTLLMEASGKKKTAWVRCTLETCERTSKLTKTPV